MKYPGPLSIGFVTVADLPEGGGRTGRLRTLVGALAGMGHRVTVWNEHGLENSPGQQVSGDLCGARYEYVLGTTEREFGFRATFLKLRAVKSILGKVRVAAHAANLDLVFFNHLAFYDTFPITRLAKRLGVPTIQCYEDERRELVGQDLGLARRVFGWNSWAADRWCSKQAAQIWVISSYLHEKYARLSGRPSRVWIIPTIIDCAAWSLLPEPDNPCPVILYSGSFGEQDDTEKLVQVLGCLKRQKMDFRMRFLGGKPGLPQVERLKSLAKEQGIENAIELKGFCPAAIVKQEITNANILVNLRTNSLWGRSGLSTKLSEYLAAGRAVLTTDIGDNARYVEDGKSALVVSPDAPAEKVAAVMKAALERPDWRRQLGAGGRQAALKHFDVQVVQKSMNEALEKVCGAAGRLQ
jgi:glycosyltransferase involved in cell wall biosynthesis